MGYWNQPKYETAEDLAKKIAEFKAIYHKDAERKPSKARLDVFLGITPKTRQNWQKDRKDLADLVYDIESWIQAETTDLAFDGNKHAEYQLSRAFKMTEKVEFAQDIKSDVTLNIKHADLEERISGITRES